MKKYVAAAALAAALPAFAHEGHDHAEAPQVKAPANASPRFEAQTEDLELVGVLDAGTLTLYLDRRTSNEPVAGAQVEVEGAGVKAVATEAQAATYRLSFPMPAAGKHPLAITVQAGELLDLVAADLVIAPAPAAGVQAVQEKNVPWLRWSLGGVLALAGISVIARRALRRQGRKD